MEPSLGTLSEVKATFGKQRILHLARWAMFILDNLWQALPRPPFTEEETEAAAKRVYDFVWQQSSSGHDLAEAA